MAFTLQNLSNQTRYIRDLIAEHPYAAGGSALVVLLSRHVSKDYQAWRTIERGGLPSNFFGYVVNRILATQGSTDVRSTSLYKKYMTDPVRSKRYIEGELPIRASAAPIISKWSVPIRQISSHAEEQDKKTLDKIIASTVTANPTSCLRAPSVQEGGGCDALWVRPSNGSKQTASSTTTSRSEEKFELYHFHHYDGSAHATLSPADAQYLLDRGWGMRHPLSGQKVFGVWEILPVNYVMVFAPRNEEETKVHEAVARAAVGYALAGGR